MNKNSIFRGTLTLLCITLIAGIALSLVYEITKKPITQAETDARAEAYQNVYSDAADFQMIEGEVELLEAAMAHFPAQGYARVTVENTLAAVDANGRVIGYVLSATSPNGYNGAIKIALGVSNDGVIQGFEPLAHEETVGYGAKCEDAAYRATFVGKTDAASIDAISGATYTTNALREAVGAALYTVEYYLKG